MIKIEIKSGEEVIEKITKIAKEKGITNASLSIIGGIDACKLSVMSKNDAMKVIETEYHEPLEMSATGEIENGTVHIHAVMGREDASALMGHLEWATVKDWFVHVYITPLE